jgi:hypothetical protein
LAVQDKIGYLIEIKDYRNSNTANLKLTLLIETVVEKVLSSLSMILPIPADFGTNLTPQLQTPSSPRVFIAGPFLNRVKNLQGFQKP